jgi:hypothetical protein
MSATLHAPDEDVRQSLRALAGRSTIPARESVKVAQQAPDDPQPRWLAVLDDSAPIGTIGRDDLVAMDGGLTVAQAMRALTSHHADRQAAACGGPDHQRAGSPGPAHAAQ